MAAQQQQLAQLQEQQQLLRREVLALPQAQQKCLMQQRATLMPPTVPLARHGHGAMATGDLMGPPVWLSKIGPTNDLRDMSQTRVQPPQARSEEHETPMQTIDNWGNNDQEMPGRSIP